MRARFAKFGLPVLVLASVAGYLAFRAVRNRAGDEDWAIGALRTINGAQVGYFDRCDGYAPTLAELIKGGELKSSELFEEATISDRGYRITLVPAGSAAEVPSEAPGCDAVVTDYFAHADPIAQRSRYFATDASGKIFEDAQPLGNPIPPNTKSLR
jgi:hypothetical protein